ncbi:MAG: molybdopterin-synthase adenylyltransferase MoeB [bacterium]
MVEFTEEQIKRYSRHILLPQVGGKGQKKLLASTVLVIGAGGLGSPVIFYLAAAGVGTIGVVDCDVVDMSNLQRQILHSMDGVNQPKTASASETVARLNPDVKVKQHQERLTSENIMGIIEDYDVVVDGCDNFPTRYLVNDACVMQRKPLVHGSVFQFEGQATVFLPGEGPCYRCLYPDPPPPGMVPSCQEAGVLGVLPGLIGLIEATETIKQLLGIGSSLAGRLLLVDGLRMRFREMKVQRSPACPVCGDNPTITELIDYEQFCNVHF